MMSRQMLIIAITVSTMVLEQEEGMPQGGLLSAQICDISKMYQFEIKIEEWSNNNIEMLHLN